MSYNTDPCDVLEQIYRCPPSPIILTPVLSAASGDLPARIYTDSTGERYARIHRVPEKQRFISLLMQPACRVAGVVQGAEESQIDESEATLGYYSHMINPCWNRPVSLDNVRADMFLLSAVVGDYDHVVIPGVPADDPPAFHNAEFELGRYYLYDFDAAFQPWPVFQGQARGKDIAQATSEKLCTLLENTSEPAKVVSLLRCKVERLHELYEGDEGYARFVALLKSANIDDELTQIFGNEAKDYWKNPIPDFYRYYMLRVDTLDELLTHPNMLQLKLLCRKIGNILVGNR